MPDVTDEAAVRAFGDAAYQEFRRQRYLAVYGAAVAAQWQAAERIGAVCDDAAMCRWVGEAHEIARMAEEANDAS